MPVCPLRFSCAAGKGGCALAMVSLLRRVNLRATRVTPVKNYRREGVTTVIALLEILCFHSLIIDFSAGQKGDVIQHFQTNGDLIGGK